MQSAGGQRAIVLIDGEHHPAAVSDALGELDAEIVSVVFCGGSEKVAPSVLADPEMHYGFPLAPGSDPIDTLRTALAETGAALVIDLADEPVHATDDKLQMASLALAAGAVYEAPGMRIEPGRRERVEFSGAQISVIGTGKRTGKTAVCGQLASLIASSGGAPAIVSMGRGGPSVPQLAEPPIGLDRLLELSRRGVHAASDYLEDAVISGVPTVGCRRVGGGPSGASGSTNFLAGARLAAGLDGVDTLLYEGSGATIPPALPDRTICVAGPGHQAGTLDAPLRLAEAQLVLAPAGDVFALGAAHKWSRGSTVEFEMVPEPVSPVPPGAKVAVFTTAAAPPEGVDAAFASTALARRETLEDDLARAAAEGCELYLTELKAAAIDTVAEFAVKHGAAVGFLRNRPVAAGGDRDADLDELLLNVWREAAGE